MTRRLPLRSQIAATALALAVTVPAFFAPHARAWWRFPAMTEAQVQASLAEVTRGHGAFTAFDAAGAEVEVDRSLAIAGTPGPCARSYDRTNDSGGGYRRNLHMRGVATFDCLFDLTVEGHGPLRALIQTQFLTDPGPHFRPTSWARSGPEARRLLDRLEARR